MNITVTFGWWLLPVVVTLASIAWALPLRADEQPTGSMFDGFRFFGPVFRLLLALVLSLIVWLIWALLR
jgi:hypothetical protein